LICVEATWIDDIEIFAISKEEFLELFLELPKGIPVLKTYKRVFAALDNQYIKNCMIGIDKLIYNP
jgi:hypothetical protein